MVTKAERPDDEPTVAQVRLIQAEGALRTVIAGSNVGAVRRIVLYLVTATALGFTDFPWSVIGLVAIVLLLATDRIV